MEKRNKKISYLLYSVKSLKLNKRSYIVLFISILCMVMMSSNLIIYNSSLSDGENEMTRQTYGTYHAVFSGLGAKKAHQAELSDHIKRFTEIKYITRINNPNTESSVKTAKLAVYPGDMKDLRFDLTEGRLPSENEMIISETLSRAMNVYCGDTMTLNVDYTDRSEIMTFNISGVYSGAEALKFYAFISDKTFDAMLGDYEEYEYCSYDVYIVFDTGSRALIKSCVTGLISDLQIPVDKQLSYQQQREPYYNKEYVEMKQFYEKPLFLLTMLINIIPSCAAIFVFILLDIFKFMNELSILSMIGTTPKQFFGILALKYFFIYIIAFPCGLGASVAAIGILCKVCENMNYNELIYLRFHISPLAVILLFVLCFAILMALTYMISKKTTSGTYYEMLSGSASVDNIFVRNTSSGILKEGKRTGRLALLFYARNRKKNLLFTAVICILAGVITYFSAVISQKIGNLPVSADRGDYVITGDILKNSASSTISEDAYEAFIKTEGVKRAISSYYEYPGYNGNRPVCYIDPSKNVSKPRSFHGAGTIQKQLNTRAVIIAEEYDRAELLYGDMTVSGSLSSLYDGTEKVAIFVHAWADSDAYYRAGDMIEIKPSYETDERTGEVTQYTSYRFYEIGAVLYDVNDEYENVNVVRFLTAPEVYTEITYIDRPAQLSLVLEDGAYGNADILSNVRKICKEYDFTYEDAHITYRQQISAMKATVAFYTILLSAAMFILLMMILSLTGFITGSNSGTYKTMHMIGADKKALMRIFGTESAVTGAVSAAGCVIISLIVIAIYASFVNLITNVFTVAVIVSAVCVTALLSFAIPVIYSKVYFDRENYLKYDLMR